MKKILLCSIVTALAFLGLCSVKAEAPTFSFIKKDEKISVRKYINAEEVSLYSECDVKDDYETKVYYKIDDGEIRQQTRCVNVDIPSEYLKNKAEHTVEAWAVNSSGEESAHDTITFLMVSYEQTVTSGNASLILKDFPINTTFEYKKVTDETILNKLGTKYVYQLILKSGDKDLEYYNEKYGKYINLGTGFNKIEGTIKLPTELTPDNNIYLYAVNNKFEIVSTHIDESADNTIAPDGIYEVNFNITNSDVFANKGYIMFRNGDYVSKSENSKLEVKENTVENPKTGVVIGLTSLSALLIAGFIMTKKNKFNKI